MVIGVGDRIEVWSKEKWDDFYNSNKEKLSDIAETLFDSDWTKGEE